MATISVTYSKSAMSDSGSAKATATITVTYSVSNNDTQTTVTASKIAVSGITIKTVSGKPSGSTKSMASTELSNYINGLTHALTFDGQTVFSTTANFTSWPSSKSVSGSKSVTKTHSAQSKTLAFHGASTAISVPAKISYAVSFNANSGSAAPSTQTKWYNETLTISSSKPTKDGYTFMGWATSVANASAGTVNYASGASYSVNAALSLYAVWELAYAKPTISSVSIERCNQNGDADDDGTYAKVSFGWSVYTSSASQYYGGSGSPYASNAPVCTVRVDSDEVTPTLTTSPTEPIIIGNGSYDTDTEYNVTITLSDTQTIKSDKSTTESGKLTTAKFPMDFNADGTAVGLLCTAPDDTSGVYLGGDVYILGNRVADFVIEQGTSGIWTYRKWASGIAECWGIGKITMTHYTTFGGFYGYYTNFTLPSGLFTSITAHNYTATVGNGFFAIPGGGQGTSTSTFRVYALASANGSQPCSFDMVVKGRWK